MFPWVSKENKFFQNAKSSSTNFETFRFVALPLTTYVPNIDIHNRNFGNRILFIEISPDLWRKWVLKIGGLPQNTKTQKTFSEIFLRSQWIFYNVSTSIEIAFLLEQKVVKILQKRSEVADNMRDQKLMCPKRFCIETKSFTMSLYLVPEKYCLNYWNQISIWVKIWKNVQNNFFKHSNKLMRWEEVSV